jgi:hypothetical protein
MDAEISQSQIDGLGEDCIAVVDHKSVAMIFGEYLAELLNRPFRRRMIGHVDVKNPARTDLHRNENVKHPKIRRDRNQEVARDDRLGMVLNNSTTGKK